MKLPTLWTMLVILPALVLQSNYKETPQQRTPPHSPTHTVKNNTQPIITLPSLVVPQSSSLVLLSSPLVPQSSTPTQTASSDENSDTPTTSPTHKHVRTRGGRVRQATGRRIRTQGGGRGTAANSVHGRGAGACRRPGHSGSRASCDSPVGSKRRFNFTSTPGVNILPEDSTSPRSILKMFLSDELIDNIVNFTNSYAEMMMSDTNIQVQMNTKQRSLFSIWKETNRDEMRLYICICLLMGIIHKRNIHVY